MFQDNAGFGPILWSGNPLASNREAIGIRAIERQDATVIIDQKRRQPCRAHPELEYVWSVGLEGEADAHRAIAQLRQ